RLDMARRAFPRFPTRSRSMSRRLKRVVTAARSTGPLLGQEACDEDQAKGEGRRAKGESARHFVAFRLTPFALRLGAFAMMRLPRFRYWTPRTAAVAVRIKEECGPEGAYVAGGTDLYPNMKRRQQTPRNVIGLARVRSLAKMRFGETGVS